MTAAKGRIVDPVSEQNGLQINWVNSAGGALGAVSSAVLLSSLGAAGTLVGAALGSLCITVGGAVYSHYLRMTKERVAAQALAARRPGRVREPGPAEARPVAQPEDPRPEDLDPTDPVDEERSLGQLFRGLPWKRILAISAALFAVAMALIVAFELSTGRAVSTYTGGTSNTSVGTSIPGWSGTGQESPDVEPDVPAPGEVQDGDVPQEQAPEEDVPQEQAPEEDVPQEQAPEEDVPQDQAPPEEDVPQDQAPPEEAPQQEPAPEQPAPEAPAP